MDASAKINLIVFVTFSVQFTAAIIAMPLLSECYTSRMCEPADIIGIFAMLKHIKTFIKRPKWQIFFFLKMFAS
jgi:hypothetical protein